MTDQSNRGALWALLFGNLVIGTGVLLPAGMLGAFITDFDVPAATAGLLMFVGGLVVGIGAPVLAALTTAIDRRILLTGSLCLYAAGHLAASFTQDFQTLIWLRAVTVIGAAIFTPQAAATVGLIVPAANRGSAIAFIFIGWSLASVVGIPMGSVLGEYLGWRPTFQVMAALSMAGAGLIWFVLPRGLFVSRINLSAWIRVLTDPRLLVVLCVTMFAMAGQFTLFTYIAPVLKIAYGADAQDIALIFLISGVMGVTGNFLASRLAGRIGVETSILLALVTTAAGLCVIALGWQSFVAFMIGTAFWGLGGFAANSLQQSRLVVLAPALASATVALNTSFVYLGQSLGSVSGGLLIGGGPSVSMAWAAAFLIVCGIGASWTASRIAPR